MLLTNDTLMQRIHRELLDHSDEELELELLEAEAEPESDPFLSALRGTAP